MLLALVAAGGAFALSQRDTGSSPRQLPALFPARFSEAGFLTGTADLVTSYDAVATSRRTSGAMSTRGNIYVVATCDSGTVQVDIGGLTSAQRCTGTPVGVIALNMTKTVQLTASVNTAQARRWGVAIYR